MERAAAPLERERVEEMLRLFGKAARAHQLYLPNNPIYKSAHDALRAAFVPIWETYDELPLAFTEHQVKWERDTVLEENTRSSDSLPWLFYKDGVREIRMVRGFETEELDRLLGILQRVRKASPDEDDLLTLLWHGDFAVLRYRYVDVTVDAVVPLAEGGEAVAESHPEPREGLEEEPQSPRGAGDMADLGGTPNFPGRPGTENRRNSVKRRDPIGLGPKAFR